MFCFDRSAETVKMRNKPISSGVKTWVMCDVGYVYAFFPHSNRFTWSLTEEYKGELMSASAVVSKLVDALKTFRDGVRIPYAIYMDKLFLSVKFSIRCVLEASGVVVQLGRTRQDFQLL